MFEHYKRVIVHVTAYDKPFSVRLPISYGSKVSVIVGSYGYKLGSTTYFERVHAGDVVRIGE